MPVSSQTDWQTNSRRLRRGVWWRFARLRLHGLHLLPLVILAAVATGCRLPGTEGPVSRSLVTCRQLSQRGVSAMERGEYDSAETLLAGAVEACPVDVESRRNSC